MSKGFMVCFDEYNRLAEGVWKKVDDFFVGTSDLRTKSSSFIMQTCNPGYAGRNNISIETSADVCKDLNKSLAYIIDRSEQINTALV